MGPNRLSRLVRKYIDQAKLGKSGSCHLFRHTVATLMLENGADIRFIQQMLGHASISTTEIYTHVAIHTLKDIHTATHPAAGASDGPQHRPPRKKPCWLCWSRRRPMNRNRRALMPWQIEKNHCCRQWL